MQSSYAVRILTLNIARLLFPSLTWKISTTEKILFLTFDDGPVPEVTPQVLDILAVHQAKATFFCIGDNIRKHPEIYKRIVGEKHETGNHTFNHLNGWKTSLKTYLENIQACDEMMADHLPFSNARKLFRPPYGKLKLSQFTGVKRDYNIVMWSVLARDWEQGRSGESCFDRIRKRAGNGSIIVFHDSLKAKERMLPALEKTLKYYCEQGYRFESLEKFTG